MKNDILGLFLLNEKLKFNEIEKTLRTRSNKLAYHIKELVRRGELEKSEDNFYKLSDATKEKIPYLSDKKSVLPVVLVCLGNKRSCLLHLRKKRPFEGKLSLPGGRLLVGESIEEASERIMNEKFGIRVKFNGINSVSLEHVRKNGRIIHSFLLIFTSAKASKKIPLTEVGKNKKRIIKSDYFLIENLPTEKIKIKKLITPIK